MENVEKKNLLKNFEKSNASFVFQVFKLFLLNQNQMMKTHEQSVA